MTIYVCKKYARNRHLRIPGVLTEMLKFVQLGWRSGGKFDISHNSSPLSRIWSFHTSCLSPIPTFQPKSKIRPHFLCSPLAFISSIPYVSHKADNAEILSDQMACGVHHANANAVLYDTLSTALGLLKQIWNVLAVKNQIFKNQSLFILNLEEGRMSGEDGCHLVIACWVTAGGTRAPDTSSTIDFVVVVKIPFPKLHRLCSFSPWRRWRGNPPSNRGACWLSALGS